MNQDEHDDLKFIHDEALSAALRLLGEHFDAVQHILASVYTVETSGTSIKSQGIGNYYARKGMIQEFVENAQAEEIARQIIAQRE